MSKEALTLFVGNATELLELIQYREDLAADPDILPADLVESLKAVDTRIEQYVKAEIQRVDGVAAYMRECETRAEALDAEKKRIAERVALWKARHDRVKEVVTRVMQSLGATLLEGDTATFKIKKNPPSVEVAQPDLVPPDLRMVAITLTEDLLQKIIVALLAAGVAELVLDLTNAKRSNPEPSKSLIASELKAKRDVPGAHLVTDKVRLEVS